MADTLSQGTFPTPLMGQDAQRSHERLTGFDLFRGLAAFAVITMHAGLVGNSGLTKGAARLDDVFGFAVPFFLLASFYFNARSIKTGSQIRPSIRKRAGRLLIPYIVWTLVYIGLRAGKFLILHQHSRIHTMFADPIAIVLLGASGVQLYFLPLLLVGLIVQLCIAPGVYKLTNAALWVFFALTVVADVWMASSGNAFSLSSNKAFEHAFNTSTLGILGEITRVGLVILAHVLRCLPLILLAFVLHRYLPPVASRKAIIVSAMLGGAILLMPLIHVLPSPAGFGDETSSIAVFLMAWSLSFLIPKSSLLTRIGAYSFGIYLCHQVFLELLQLVFKQHGASHHVQGLLFILGVSAVVFAMSWIAVWVASLCNTTVKKSFGLEIPKSPTAV